MDASAGRHRWFEVDPNRSLDPESSSFRLGTVEGALAEAHFRLGDLERCDVHGWRALVHFGQPFPEGTAGLVARVATQAARRGLQAARGSLRRRPAVAPQQVASEVARVHLRLMEVSFYRMELLPLVCLTLGLLNHCVPAGPSSVLAQGYVVSGLLCYAARARRFGGALCRRALTIAEGLGSARDVAWVLGRWANIQKGSGRWEDAATGLERGAELAREVGDLRLWEECVAQRGFVDFYSGRFESALTRFREVHAHTARSENRQIGCWGLILQGDALLRLGHIDDAIAAYERAATLIDPVAMRTEAICLDWLAPLHDPAVDLLLPVLQGASVVMAREAYIARVELGSLAAETAGRPARILDVGVGTGSDLPYLERHLPPGLDVELWGLDFSAGMLALCRRRLASHGGRPMRLVHGDAHELPFADGTFDRVLHVGGIAGYRAPARALAEMARVARPGTPIVVVDEQLDADAEAGWLRRLAFRALTFYDPDPHAPRECLPPTAFDVVTEQVSPFYCCLRFRASGCSAGC